METILKHLRGDEQYLFLSNYFSMFLPQLDNELKKKAEIIQKIMDDVNAKK